MATSGLYGPYPMSVPGVDANAYAHAPGAYALGETRADGVFLISRIGRSDSDLKKRLKDYAGKYPQFKYGYYDTALAAFMKECHLFHDFSPPDNVIHPDRPVGTDWKCPRCNVLS